MKRRVLVILLTLLLVSLAVPVLADGPDGDVVIAGKNYVLESGDTIKGDLVVFGGNVTLESGSKVNGDVTLFGGNLAVSGEVKGDVTVLGGNVDLRAQAIIRGRVMSMGGHVDRHPNADVRGGQVEGLPFELPLPKEPKVPETPKVPEAPTVPVRPPAPPIRVEPNQRNVLRGITSFFRSAFGILLMVVLGILVVTFIPQHTDTVAETMVKAPGKSFVSGLVALLGGSVILAILAAIGALLTATICLAPVGLALFLPALVAGVAILFGWIAAGLLLGTKVLRAVTKKEPTPVAAVAAGILLLTLISNVPCAGWALAVAMLMWSVGAVVQSLFGTRPYDAAPAVSGSNDLSIDAEYDPRMDQL